MTNETKRNAIVLLIDGLNPAFLSPYGCTWIDTPAFDRLAAESVVFERAVTESVDSDDAFWSFLSGLHPGLRSTNQTTSNRWEDVLADPGLQTMLLTDDPGPTAESQLFEQVIRLPGLTDLPTTSAENVSETVVANCFAGALSELAKVASPFLCVIHLSSLTKSWDAPLSLREKFRDEEDPDALASIHPPSREGNFDPDEILVTSHAYAAQLETLDTCLDVTMQELKQEGLLDETMLMLAGLRGFPVGHHGQMGHAPSHVGSDATSVALFIRPPESDQSRMPATRTHELTCVSEWFDYVMEWLTHEKRHRFHSLVKFSEFASGTDDGPEPRQFVVVSTDAARAIWTPAWLLTECNHQTRLFVKPDDRWDFNPVQDRCRWIAEDLLALLEKASQQLDGNVPISLDPLADELVFGLE